MEQKDSKKKTTKRFHRHFETPGVPIYWIIIAYILLGWFFPVIGLLALICMIGPVLTSIFKGRWWCGHVCPRGNMYDRLLSKYSPHRPIPKFVRTFGFRLFMVLHLRHVRHPTDIHRALERGRTGHVVWNRQSVLDDYRHDHHRRRHTFVHLCPTHLVFVLSHGNHL